MKSYHFFVFLLVISFSACTSNVESESSPPVAIASPADFDEEKQVSAQLADGLEMSLWAPGPLLSNAVALTFDNQGVAYVAETARRKSSDLDIRQHRDWMTEELSLQTIEDTRDFHLKKLATDLSDQNTWQEDFNEDGVHDYRDLEVQSEYIRRVWDSDGDGRADKSTLFAEGFNDMLTGVAAGILHYDDEVYLTAAPDVYRLKDVDQDGIADERTKISHGYGIHIAYAGHDMSGLTIGPDGRVYWSIGDIGVNAVGPDGKRWAYPNEGAVMRCNPDGTDFEVFAHGLRNPQEIDFDAYGNLISVDNDGDHPGEHERYVHIVEGSDTGWRINWQFGKYNLPNESYKVWMDEKLYIPHFPGQAAYITPALALAYDGPAGLAYNPGTALGEEWEDCFFASFFTASSARSKIQAFKIKPKGASFEITNIKDAVGGIVPTGITFAADGALYINDWKDSYDKKPTGRVWKLTATNEHPKQRETQELLKAGLGGNTVKELSTLIAHQDRRIRMAAQFELVKKGEATTLLTIAKDDTNLFARLHAIWGIGQLARKDSEAAAPLLALLEDEQEQIRAQAAKVIGDAKYQPAFDLLINQLQDEAAPAQFFAAEALGKLVNPAAFDPLVNLLAQVKDSDTHMRHAVVYALSRLKQEDKLAALSEHPSLQVRIGAVVALRTLRSPKITTFLTDKETLVLWEAARAINDDLSIPDALPALAKTLETATIKDEIFLRRAINANLRVGDAASAQRLAAYAQSQRAPIDMRLDALWALGYWSDPMPLDRVDGRYRELNGHNLNDAQQAIASVFSTLTANRYPEIIAGVITAVGRVNDQDAAPEVFNIFKNKAQGVEIRQAALGALAMLKSSDLLPALDLALSDKAIELRQDAQELLGSLSSPEDEVLPMLVKVLENNTSPEQQKALASLATLKTPEAAQVLKKTLDELIQGKVAPEIELDILTAIDKSSFEKLKQQKKEYEASIDPDDVLAQYKMTMYGGNAETGRRIFRRNNTAQCLRCHVLNGRGGEVGPELTNIASALSHEQLLEALIAPNARIAPGYGTVILKLKDGKELAGLLQEETGENLVIKVGNDPVQTIAVADIAERENLPSGMFNMAQVLEKGQIRDLMAFLMTME